MKTFVKSAIFVMAAAGLLFAAGPENHRFFGDRNSKDKRYELGGSATVDSVILNALNWLSVHQHPDGRFSPAHFDENCKGEKCDGTSNNMSDAEGTGLALLCFLGAGESDTGDGRFKLAVSQTAKYLMKIQKADGSFENSGKVWESAVCAWALAEYRMWHTEDDAIKSAVVKARDYLVSGENNSEIRVNDPHFKVSSLYVIALRAIQESGINVDSKIFKKSLEFFTSDNSAIVDSRALGAIMCGAKKSDKIIEELKNWAMTNHRRWKTNYEVNFSSVFFAAHALFQFDGLVWKGWEKDCRESILKFQEKGGTPGCVKGSFPMETGMGPKGRMYSTEMAVLTLEVYTRFKRFME
jgi:hypothetical protein